MSITPSDIRIRYSTPLGAQGNSLPQTVPNNSLGGYIATTDWLGASLGDLFDLVTGAKNIGLQADYRCIFIYNSNGTFTLQNAVVWISALTAGGCSFALGVDPTAALAVASAPVQAVTVANTTTAPAGVAFTSPASFGTALSLGNIPPGFVRALWLRRTAINGVPLASDAATISIQGNTD